MADAGLYLKWYDPPLQLLVTLLVVAKVVVQFWPMWLTLALMKYLFWVD